MSNQVLAYEKNLEAWFRKQIRLAGGDAVKIVGTGENGVPDRMILLKGKIFLVEMKRPGGKLRPDQIHWHSRAASMGVTVYTLSSREECRQWIKDRLDEMYYASRQRRGRKMNAEVD